MSVHRRIHRGLAAGLAATALTATGIVVDSPAGARPSTSAGCLPSAGHGDPGAAPPILPTPSCSAQLAMREQEAYESLEFWYDPPATEHYNKAALNGYRTRGR